MLHGISFLAPLDVGAGGMNRAQLRSSRDIEMLVSTQRKQVDSSQGCYHADHTTYVGLQWSLVN